jgi:hypothetical protein
LLSTQGLGSPGTAVYVACKAFQALDVDVTSTYIDVVFNNLPSVSGPSADPTQWVITSLNGGRAVTVTAVVPVTNRLRLYTTEHTTGKLYRVTIQHIGLVDQFLNPFDGLFSIDYVGAGNNPQALLARSIDARLMEVVFDEPVNEAEAVIAANYSISPPLTVVSVTVVSPTIMRLVTSRQTRAQLYTVTVSGIHDISGNLI